MILECISAERRYSAIHELNHGSQIREKSENVSCKLISRSVVCLSCFFAFDSLWEREKERGRAREVENRKGEEKNPQKIWIGLSWFHKRMIPIVGNK